MTIVMCKECQHEVSTTAKHCPHCGAKPPRKAGVGTLLLAILGTLFVYQFTKMSWGPSPTPTPAEQVAQAPDIAPDPAPAPVPAPDPTWHYLTTTDSLTSKELQQATLKSRNTVALSSPYSSETQAELILRKHPRYGNDVIFSVSSGQLICGISDGCNVLVRFDDKPPREVRAGEPSDHSNDTLFLLGYKQLSKSIKESKRMIVEVTFFQDGSRHFEFNTENLDF